MWINSETTYQYQSYKHQILPHAIVPNDLNNKQSLSSLKLVIFIEHPCETPIYQQGPGISSKKYDNLRRIKVPVNAKFTTVWL
jgi:hypothetical protein